MEKILLSWDRGRFTTKDNNISKKIIDHFPALSYRNFRLYWGGQLISLVGTWMQNIGQAWLVLQLTDSAFKLGAVTALQFLPLTLFSLFAGTFVDRFPKRRILLCTQTSFMILALILATLTYLNKIAYWHILILALCLGIVNTLDLPARQSIFVELVGKDSLMNAIALNSTVFQLGKVMGPAVAGILIGLLGMGPCFYLNALSFCPVILSLWLIDTPCQGKKIKDQNIFLNILDGLSHVRNHSSILLPLVLLAFFGIFVINNYNVLVPVYAKENLEQNALGYGFLMTSLGLGSLLGAISLAAKSKRGPRMRVLFGGGFGVSISMFLLGFEKVYILACVTLFVLGICHIIFIVSVNSTIQLYSEDQMRGRVMSIYALVYDGATPIGSLFSGQISEVGGVNLSLAACGGAGFLVVVIAALIFFKCHTGEAGE
jgi:MFS family permease